MKPSLDFDRLRERYLMEEYDVSLCYDPHDTVMLYYEVNVNRFFDNSGMPYNDIHRMLRPWQIMLFKNTKECMTFHDITNTFLVELVYPDEFYTRHS